MIVWQNLMRTAADNLIEHLAEANRYRDSDDLRARSLRLCDREKPDAPIDGDFDWMGVQIVRTRQSAFDEQNRSWRTAWLRLGSNLGDRARICARPVLGLKIRPAFGCWLCHRSMRRIVGVTEQPLFLNAVCKVETCLTPTELLACCQAIENRHGRVRDMRCARTLVYRCS